MVDLEEKKKIGMLLKMLHNNIVAQCNRELEEIDLTGSQSDIMSYLIFNEGKEINQKDIELKFDLMNPTVTGILKRLEKKDFIIRVKSNADARYKKVELTERGREVRDILYKKAEEMHERLFKGLSEVELDAFENTIRTLIKNISV